MFLKSNFILFFVFIVFFPLPFSSLIPIPPTVTILLSMSTSPFSFLLRPPTPYPPPALRCHPALYLWVCFYFACQFSSLDSTYMSEIIWYLSFSDWLISLGIIFSRSIHTVTKVKLSSFLHLSRIPFCKCPIVVLSTHLLMAAWAASIAWQL